MILLSRVHFEFVSVASIDGAADIGYMICYKFSCYAFFFAILLICPAFPLLDGLDCDCSVAAFCWFSWSLFRRTFSTIQNIL